MEINLLEDYPKTVRDVNARKDGKNEDIILRAKKFDWEYFDRKVPKICYGGYIYDGRWVPIAKKFIEFYGLKSKDKVLEVGSAKGYLLYDLIEALPGLQVRGMDISEYAINCSPPMVRSCNFVGNAKDLSWYRDKEFNLVISINTIHNLVESECRRAVREIQRVGKKAFITVDTYSNDYEKERMMAWNTTAETILSVEDWKKLFEEEKYTGDFYWFKP